MMDFQESQDKQLPPVDSVVRGTSQQYRFNQSTSQNCENPQHFSSNGSISHINTGLCEYSETDPLLPNELYSGSSLSQSTRAKDTDSSGAPAESVCSMMLQILVPFVLAGLGTVSAGMLLDVVQVRSPEKAEDHTEF